MKFNINTDVNISALEMRVEREALEIYSKESTRRGRPLEEIKITSMYGLAAEVFLLQQGYVDDTRPYKDLFEPLRFGGNSIEVKVTEGEYFVPYVLKRANAAAAEKWRDYPNRLYIFIGDRKTGDYSLEGIYDFDGVQFIKNVV